MNRRKRSGWQVRPPAGARLRVATRVHVVPAWAVSVPGSRRDSPPRRTRLPHAIRRRHHRGYHESRFARVWPLIRGVSARMKETPFMSSAARRPPETRGRINWNEVKRAFPLREVMLRELGHGRMGQKMWKCPFHEDSTASLSVDDRGSIELWKCHAGHCLKGGSVVDFIWERHPELRGKGAETLAYLGNLTGRGVEGLRDAPAGRNPRPNATERHEAGGTVVERKRFSPISMVEVEGRHEMLRSGVAYAEARRYAEERGWLVPPDAVYGANPYPVGVGNWKKGWLSEFPLPMFPKLIRTERLAFLCGLEKEFEARRELCIGRKLRLTDRVFEDYWRFRIERNPTEPADELKPIRWWCLPNFLTTSPGELDGNEEAEVLVIAEGPGDGLRLFNEAHATPQADARFGSRWHITYCENAGIWTPASLERRCRKIPLGGGRFQLQPVSFFDGYKLVILLFDPDEAGRDAANMAEWLAHRQAPRTPVKKVALPDVDLSDFFSGGATIYDLVEIIARTESTRGVDNPHAPAPLNAAQRKALAERERRAESPAKAEAAVDETDASMAAGTSSHDVYAELAEDHSGRAAA